MTTLPNMGLVLPTRGSSGEGLWGDAIDAALAQIDAHDHTTGKGPRVPTAGLNINADLPFSSLYAPTQLHRVQFSSIAAAGLTGSNNKSLFVSDGTSGLVANELYWRNNSGNHVRVTSGNSLNISLVGGIGGDYTSVGAQLNYDDAGKRYTLKEGTSDSNGWSRVASGDVRLFPFGTTGTFFVGHAAPGGIAASYTMTWPATLPGAQSLLQVDATGQISASNALATNQSVTVSGTGTYKHGTQTLLVPLFIGVNTAGIAALPQQQLNLASSTGANLPILLPLGKRIIVIRMRVIDSVTGPTTLKVGLSIAAMGTAGSATTFNVGTASAGTGVAQTITSAVANTTITSGNNYYATVFYNSGTAATGLIWVEVDYDQP